VRPKPSLTIALLLVLGLVAAAGSAIEEAGQWVCPPCGHADDNHLYDAPGPCPICGMPLVPTEGRVKVAILLYDGVEIIDFAGPWEVFGQAELDVFSVSETGEPVATVFGMTVTPDYSFASSPEPDLVLVPGGNIGIAKSRPKVMQWIRDRADKADHLLSVCNGAFILADLGLLDGKRATTVRGGLADLAERYPRVEVVPGARFTDNGSVLTSAGLSAGIDAALHLVGRLQGLEAARKVARDLEYDWSPSGSGTSPDGPNPD
jgi:transcriptional regulator GlxA family with amidase domain